MGRESSHGTEELFNLPPLDLKAVALPPAGFGLPEQAMGGFPIRFGIGSIRQIY